jgi:hypothetical protein
MTTLLALTLGLAAGWYWGHRTARIRIINVGATPDQDHDTLMAEAIRDLNDACCERWWTAIGTDHDPDCPNQQRRSDAA